MHSPVGDDANGAVQLPGQTAADAHSPRASGMKSPLTTSEYFCGPIGIDEPRTITASLCPVAANTNRHNKNIRVKSMSVAVLYHLS